jgi:hypothetical protein
MEVCWEAMLFVIKDGVELLAISKIALKIAMTEELVLEVYAFAIKVF